MRKTVISAVATAALFMMGMSGTALASSAHRPAMSSGPVHFSSSKFLLCPGDQSPPGQICIQSNGAGNQLTINNPGGALFTTTAVGSYYTLKNAAGNCVYESTSHRIILRPGGCTNVDTQEWTVTNHTTGAHEGYYFRNRKWGNYMVTDGVVDGFKVWGASQTGRYYAWNTCNPSGTECFF